ncbi:hypothetical protein FKM82_010706 [Ascaphus truei]
MGGHGTLLTRSMLNRRNGGFTAQSLAARQKKKSWQSASQSGWGGEGASGRGIVGIVSGYNLVARGDWKAGCVSTARKDFVFFETSFFFDGHGQDCE